MIAFVQLTALGARLWLRIMGTDDQSVWMGTLWIHPGLSSSATGAGTLWLVLAAWELVRALATTAKSELLGSELLARVSRKVAARCGHLAEFECTQVSVTSPLGRLDSNQWSDQTLPCHFQACPDVFPLGSDPVLYVVRPCFIKRAAASHCCSCADRLSLQFKLLGPMNGGSARLSQGLDSSTNRPSRQSRGRMEC